MTAVEWVRLGVALAILACTILAIYAAWWAIFGDRERGRRRCPRCWHDLSHTPGLICGECGHVARSERSLLRSRRRWALATAAILACVGMAIYVNFSLERRGWTEYLPTRVIVLLLPVQGDSGGAMWEELSRRVARDRLGHAQWSALVRRSVKGDRGARPASDAWIDKYAPFLEAWRFRQASDVEAWTDAHLLESVLGLPPRLTLTAHSPAAAGTAPQFRFQMLDWWPWGPSHRVRITPRIEGAQPLAIYRSGAAGGAAGGHSFEVEALRGHIGPVEFLVDVDRELEPGRDGGDRRWRRMAHETFTVEIDDSGPALEPVDDERLADAIRATFDGGVVRWRGGPAPVRFTFNPQRTFLARFDDIAIGVHADLMRGEAVARRLDIWWLAGSSGGNRGWGADSHEDLELLEHLRDGEGWVLRIAGDPALAVRAGGASRCWSGTVTIPVKVNDRDGDADPLGRWTEQPQ